jgi:hypothetical protein
MKKDVIDGAIKEHDKKVEKAKEGTSLCYLHWMMIQWDHRDIVNAMFLPPNISFLEAYYHHIETLWHFKT